MQTKGNVTMEHMEMLLNAGIPAIEMYADAIGCLLYTSRCV